MANDDNGPDEDFVLLETKGDLAGAMALSFGKSSDPSPFKLTVTQSYVAEKIQKTPGLLTIQELQNYCTDKREELRSIAFDCKQRGLTTKTLT
jgi:hypothetical protein